MVARVDRDWINRSAARIILRGLQAGYPSCCVYQFAADSYVEEAAEYVILDEATVARLREHFHLENAPEGLRLISSSKMRRGPEGYVRCWDCLERPARWARAGRKLPPAIPIGPSSGQPRTGQTR